MRICAIDQSLTGTAYCVLNNAEIETLETIDTKGLSGFHRIHKIVSDVRSALTAHEPDVVVLEDYAYMASTNTLTQLAELAGILKWVAFEAGYVDGAEALRRGTKAMTTQTVSQMKKFCLGNGAVQKGPRYLLDVFERIHKSFKDDNQADAYMHAWMCSLVIGVLQGRVPIGNLTPYQQEALIAHGVRSARACRWPRR